VVEAALSSFDMDVGRNGLARHELFELGGCMIALALSEAMRDEEKQLILRRLETVLGKGPLNGIMFGFSQAADGTALVNAAYDALEGRRALCGMAGHGRLFVLHDGSAESEETILSQALSRESGADVLAGNGGQGTLDTLASLYGRSSWALAQRSGTKAMALPDQIEKYIEQNYAKGITLAQAAQQFNISYTHLSKLFKMQFQMPFIDYLTNVRMNHAMNLLSNTTLNVQEIAASCGYDNVFHFSRAFKKRFGAAPSHYRKSQQGR
jgi:AraC-like DNA-binding protein